MAVMLHHHRIVGLHQNNVIGRQVDTKALPGRLLPGMPGKLLVSLLVNLQYRYSSHGTPPSMALHLYSGGYLWRCQENSDLL